MPVEGEVREFAVPAEEGTGLRVVFQKRIYDGENWLLITNTDGSLTQECDVFVDEYLERCKERAKSLGN
jgi:hypothetical protein